MVSQEACDGLGVLDGGVHEGHGRVVQYAAKVVEVAGVGEGVEDDQAVARVVLATSAQVGADKSGTTGDRDGPHRPVSPLCRAHNRAAEDLERTMVDTRRSEVCLDSKARSAVVTVVAALLLVLLVG